jgi:hypothetical protein
MNASKGWIKQSATSITNSSLPTWLVSAANLHGHYTRLGCSGKLQVRYVLHLFDEFRFQ